MSLIKSLEIDTLRVRDVLIKTADNSNYPANYQIFSRGDGTTYWAPGVTAAQVLSISSQLTGNTSSITGNAATASTSLAAAISSSYTSLTSTLYSISTFTQNLSTFSAGTAYTDIAIATYSTALAAQIASTYTRIVDTENLSAQLNSAIVSSNGSISNQINTMSQEIVFINIATQFLSTNVSNKITELSTYVTEISTAQGSTNTVLQNQINTNKSTLDSNIESLSTVVGSNYEITQNYPSTWAAADAALSSNIANSAVQVLAAANEFTSENISSVLSTTTHALNVTSDAFMFLINFTNTQVNNSIVSSATGIMNYTYNLSTNTGTQINAINTTFSTFFSIGLPAKIYQTFTELSDYSARIVLSTMSTSSGGFNSTVTTYTHIYNSTLNYINLSSLAYLNSEALISLSTIVSTLTPQASSTIVSMTSSYLSSMTNTVSTVFGLEYISISKALLSTTIVTTSTYIGAAIENTFREHSTAPSIIMNSVNNISTILNVQAKTGLSSLVAGVVTLDITENNNFYMLISDIGNNIYYGLTYSTNITALMHRDINLQIDIFSTYTNKYITLDTENLSGWLNQPQILTPLGQAPSQLIISTFVGSYVLEMRYTPKGLLMRNLYTYPYVYSKVVLDPLTFPSNVKVSALSIQASTFMYAGTQIPMSWTTNDLNIPLAFNFLGQNSAGETFLATSGPYISGNYAANVRAPIAPYVITKYTALYVSVFTSAENQADGNISAPRQVFYTYNFPQPIYVYRPTLNTRLRIYNDGSVAKYLQVAEIGIYNALQENVTNDKLNVYAALLSTSSTPYNGDLPTWGPQRAYDGNLATYFWGGTTPILIDQNAYMTTTLSTLSTAITSSIFISSIVISAAPQQPYANPTLGSMKVNIENFGQSGIPDGLFYSTITLTDSTVTIFRFE